MRTILLESHSGSECHFMEHALHLKRLPQSQWRNFGFGQRWWHNFLAPCCIWQTCVTDTMPAVRAGFWPTKMIVIKGSNLTQLQVKRLAFSPNGSILASAHSENVVALWSRWVAYFVFTSQSGFVDAVLVQQHLDVDWWLGRARRSGFWRVLDWRFHFGIGESWWHHSNVSAQASIFCSRAYAVLGGALVLCNQWCGAIKSICECLLQLVFNTTNSQPIW